MIFLGIGKAVLLQITTLIKHILIEEYICIIFVDSEPLLVYCNRPISSTKLLQAVA